ncbi:unnamed protein product [Ilex paraguariensis]|uniref:Death domain-containing protein n=1 Tax=Ilex paraguariensis TaxID=185542 RepID=A0ABC8QP87_9AQUA
MALYCWVQKKGKNRAVATRSESLRVANRADLVQEPMQKMVVSDQSMEVVEKGTIYGGFVFHLLPRAAQVEYGGIFYGFLAYITFIQLINAIGEQSLAHPLPYLTERASPRALHKVECNEELRSLNKELLGLL